MPELLQPGPVPYCKQRRKTLVSDRVDKTCHKVLHHPKSDRRACHCAISPLSLAMIGRESKYSFRRGRNAVLIPRPMNWCSRLPKNSVAKSNIRCCFPRAVDKLCPTSARAAPAQALNTLIPDPWNSKNPPRNTKVARGHQSSGNLTRHYNSDPRYYNQNNSFVCCEIRNAALRKATATRTATTLTLIPLETA